MSGVELMRSLAMLGAECAMATPADETLDTRTGWPARSEDWTRLRAEMDAHLASEDPWLHRLRDGHGLSMPGYWLVMLCAAVELVPEAAAAVSILAESEQISVVTPTTFARLMRAVGMSEYDAALAEAAPGCAAEGLGLVAFGPAQNERPWSQQPLRLAPAMLRRLLGHTGDTAVSPLVLHREPPAAVLAFDSGLATRAAELLAERGLLCIRGASSRAARQLAFDIATLTARPALVIAAEDELPDPEAVRLIRGGLPVVDATGRGQRGMPMGFAQGLAAQNTPILLLLHESAETGAMATVDVEHLDYCISHRIWKSMLTSDMAGATDAVPETAMNATNLARRFHVTTAEARMAVTAAADAERIHGGHVGPLTRAAIEKQVLLQGARRMGNLVTRISSKASLDDLVVPGALRQQLLDIVDWYRTSPTVHGEWSVGWRSPLGRGLVCLFSGSPGTGKTFAAQGLANTLGLNLYRIDLSQVVSKYIGETEKHLARIFEEAEAGHGILLFDEADSLFGKRSPVKDAHDRYANIEIGYLLQRLESYDGIAVLTTNQRGNMDAAFLRRIAFVLEFPVPDSDARLRLWQQSLPMDRVHASVDLGMYAERFRMAGGHIANIGVAAAHLAAARGDVVEQEHLVRATLRELEKAGLARSRKDFGPLAAWLPE
ncbi:MAG TPA: ATP-binding protein [Haliangium sp.]|nr:ATP-binding protein [Haliangium sp.]